MTNPTTAAEWLAIAEDKLPEKLGEALAPDTGYHLFRQLIPEEPTVGINYQCVRCKKVWASSDMPSVHEAGDCPIPDPININDWNVAMKWRDKIFAGRYSTVFATYLLEVFGGGTEGDIDECFAKAQPCDYLIAAALAAGRNKT